ncbi:MAG: RagB/SusD family nutrient uptake outer membrane protein [Prevotellaceae bacterium]|jgi:hypothetical protein|nr:RagB/SusD family nutrient uptake outer membrane protein [Prevotellaceae bacterium]
MKKFKLYAAALLMSGMGATACSERFLDVEPMTQLLDNNFYATVSDAEMALIGCYDGFQRTTSNGNQAFYVTAEVLSDDCFGATGNADNRIYQVLDRFDPAQDPSQNNIFNGTWSDYYAGIFRCNTLIGKLNGIDFADDEAARPRIEGETRFLRALLYFDLVRLFENIPLITVPTTDNVPQANPAEVYRLIAGDLKFAAANIPANAYPKASAATNDGRATRYAAQALLARVYLFYTGYYGQDDLGVTKAEALAGLEDVISCGEFDLVPEYKALWPAASYLPVPEDNSLDMSGYAGMGNVEAVFTQKFNSTQDYSGNLDGNRWQVMMGLRNTNHSPYGQGWGACTVNPDLLSAFDPLDARKIASIIDIKGDITGDNFEADFDVKDQREYTGYSTKKYSPTCFPDGASNTGGEGNFQDSQDQDFVLIRFADVLLMAAELGSPSAQAYFDRVRARAGLTAPLTASRENIIKERRLEFAFEGIRYWDLLRQGLDVAATAIATSKTLQSGGEADMVVISADRIRATRGFMQIPATQITLSKDVLKQNSGWN